MPPIILSVLLSFAMETIFIAEVIFRVDCTECMRFFISFSEDIIQKDSGLHLLPLAR